MRQPVPFGKYLLLDRISVGGMAEVFKAKSYGVEGFEKIIAIKRILPTMGEDRDFIKMFIDEAKIAGQLAHANICQIFELGRIDGSHFIAMEYIWGKDLLQIQNRLRKIKQAMPVQMACFAIAKVLEGLDYAHRKRDPLGRPLEIVHRDCSPQNVLVSYEGEVKVIDFGIAKATSRNSRTMAGVLKGKFGYMSPEQVRGLPLDRRSDIFALGTMLYECLTSDRLFQGETDFSTLEKVRNVDIQPPRSINPAIPEVVENVIMKALAKDVDDRYQWCSEMLADLQQYLMAQEVVFTAKTLSSWLKELFQSEIDRERQLLEQYKRVGRDGLIGGVPSVEASRDVNEHLGEAAPAEGDPTTLGGPSFEDMEQELGASPQEVGPASGSPAAQGRDEDHTNDFGEEAPTEIFGEIDDDAKPLPAAAQPRAPTSSQPISRPPKPPPGRPSREQPIAISAQMSATNGSPRPSSNMGAMPQQDPYGYQPPQASPSQGFVAQSYAQPSYQNPYPGYGTPNQPQQAVGQQMTGLAQPNQPQSRTLLGAAAPVGYGGYDPRAGSGSSPPPYGQPMQGYPSQPQMLGQPYPAPHPSQQYMAQPGTYPPPPGAYPSAGQLPGYMPPSGAFPAVPAMQEQALPVEGTRRKSTLIRDVMIGVAIAALVLVGFLAVKFFILDKDGSDTVAETSSLGNVLITLPKGVTAELFVDGKHNSTVDDAMKIPVSAGSHKLKLVATKGEGSCENDVKVAGGKDPTPFDCKLVGDGTKPADDTKPASTDTKTDPKTDTKSDDKTDTKAASEKTDSKTDTKTDTKTDPKIDPKIDPKSASTKTDAKTDTKTPPTVDPKTTDKTVAKTDVGHTTTKTMPADTKTKSTDPSHPKTDKMPSEDKTVAPPGDVGSSAAKGFLQVYSKPTAKILVDGVDTGMSTPISGRSLQLTPGKHKITFVIGDDRFTYSQTIKGGVTETMSKDLQ